MGRALGDPDALITASGATNTAALRSRLAMFPLAVALFASSGVLRWIAAWIYIALLVARSELMLFGPLRVDEGLNEERLTRQPGAKPWDRIFVALVAVVTLSAILVRGSTTGSAGRRNRRFTAAATCRRS